MDFIKTGKNMKQWQYHAFHPLSIPPSSTILRCVNNSGVSDLILYISLKYLIHN